MRRSLPMERPVALCSRGPPAGGMGHLPMEHLRGTAAASGPGLAAGGTGSFAQAAVAAYGAPAADDSLHQRRLTSWGDRKSFPGGGRYLWRGSRGRQHPTSGANELCHRLMAEPACANRWRGP